MTDRGRPRTGSRTLLIVAAAAGYIAVGLWLTLDVGFIMGDALSRVQAAQAVLSSRFPQLTALGFVFTPLPGLAALPEVALSPWFPAMTRYGLAGVVMSAVFMAFAVDQVRLAAADRGLPMWLQLAVTGTFALHPMIILYAANGMSEAPFILAMCWATRHIIRWLSTDDVHDLVVAGCALALAFLTRYDAVVTAAATTAVVAAVSVLRSGGGITHRLWCGLVDAVVLAGPPAVAFLGWTGASWLITGEALSQFTSDYGNSTVLESSGGPEATGLAALAFADSAMLVLAPTLPLLIPLIGALAWRRRDPEPIAVAVVLGTVLAFQTLAHDLGLTFGFLRFFIIAIPMATFLLIQLSPPSGQLPSRRPGQHAVARREFPPMRTSAAAGALAAVAVGMPLTAYGMASPSLAPQEYALRSLFIGPADSAEVADRERRILATFDTERSIADYLDAQQLPEGSVLMDTVFGFAIAAASDNPRQFVIPSDNDFVDVLDSPDEHPVRYILTVPATGRGSTDAVNRRYPGIFENGAGVATLELEVPNDGADQPTWRIYRVINPIR